MYTVEFRKGWWWIIKNEEIQENLGHFIDPISPEIIVEEIKKHGEI